MGGHGGSGGRPRARLRQRLGRPGRRRASGLALVAVAAILVSLWVGFAPTQIGGSVTYLTVVGNSMGPSMKRGDLALVRSRPEYEIGEVVLYRSPALRQTVLHRIIAIDDGRYHFKGDNNDFVDNEGVPRSALVGRLWLRIPSAGKALAWLGKPVNAALVTGTAALLLSGTLTVKRRRRRGRGGSPTNPRSSTGPATSWRESGHVPTPYVLAAVLLLVALGALILGYTAPLQRTARLPDAFRHQAEFSYEAPLDEPNIGFPRGKATTGDPLFFHLFESVTLAFDYEFASKLPHDVKGTIALHAQISDPTGWRNLYPLQPATPFVGDAAEAGGRFALPHLRTLMDELARNSQLADPEYTIAIQAVVHVVGTVDGREIDSTFSPALPFSVTRSHAKIDAAPASLPPGATFAPPESDPVNPVAAGSIPTRVANTVEIARQQIRVSTLRAAGAALLFLALVIAGGQRMFGGRKPIDRVQALCKGCLMVDVASLEGSGNSHGSGWHGSGRWQPRTEVTDAAGLVRMARYLEQPILRVAGAGASVGDLVGDLYAVRHDGVMYVHRCPPVASVGAPNPSAEDGAPTPSRAHRGRRPAPPRTPVWRRPAAVGAMLIVPVVVGASLLPSFTATNTVPPSRVGRSIHGPLLAQFVPLQCQALGINNVVLASSTNTNGTNQNDLIIGRGYTGNVSYSGGQGNDCIVAGGQAGTTNQLDGGPGTNICIAPAAATNTRQRCT